MTLAVAEALRERLHTRAMVDVAPEIRRLPRTKSPVELEKLAHAAAITDAATDEIVRRLHGGPRSLHRPLAIGGSLSAPGGGPAFGKRLLARPHSPPPPRPRSSRPLP